MAKTLDQSDLINLLTSGVREELIGALGPIVAKIAEAAAELQAVLGGAAAPKRRGRKPGSGKPGPKPGPKPAASAVAAAPAAPKAKRGRRKGGNAPRGALKAAVIEILQKSSKPIALGDIVKAVMKTDEFRGRNAKSIYNKVNADLSKSPEVVRVGKGVYSLKGK